MSFEHYSEIGQPKMLQVYSDDYFIFENLDFSAYPNFYPNLVIYNGKSFLILNYFNKYIEEIEVKGKISELYNNSPFFVGEDG